MPKVQLAQIRSNVYSRIEENAGFYPSGQIDGQINEALNVLNLYTGFYQQRVAGGTLTIAGRVVYDMPAGVLYPLDVWLEKRRLHPTGVSDICRSFPNFFRNAPSARTPQQWAPIGIRKLLMTPPDRNGGLLWEVSAVMEVPALAQDADVMVLSDEYIELVEDYAFHTTVINEGGKVFHDSQALYSQKFLGRMKSLQRWTTLKNPLYAQQVRSRP